MSFAIFPDLWRSPQTRPRCVPVPQGYTDRPFSGTAPGNRSAIDGGPPGAGAAERREATVRTLITRPPDGERPRMAASSPVRGIGMSPGWPHATAKLVPRPPYQMPVDGRNTTTSSSYSALMSIMNGMSP